MIDYEPYSERARRDPYGYYRKLRQHAPVYWAEQADAWIVSRYDDVHSILTRPELFSSDAMGAVLTGQRNRPATENRVVILMDPPNHTAFRNIVSRGFTPRRIAALEPRLRGLVADSMQKIRGGACFDLIAELAIPVPVTIIAELLGVETERLEDFKRWSDAIIAAVSGSQRRAGSGDFSALAAPLAEYDEYFQRIIEEREREPREDLISVLVRAQDGESALRPQEIITFALTLLVAGNETTTNLIGNMVMLLLDHPGQLEQVRRDPRLIPNLIEETLRFETPLQFAFRRVRREVEIAGTVLPKDSIVMPLLASANRDERRFERPDEFDILRSDQGHLTFGFGPHFCMGASLARLEAQVTIEALLEELPRLRRRSESRESIDSFMLRGPRRLDLEWI
ncbi:MAG: cytochrome P450 [Myxococcota bacterium]